MKALPYIEFVNNDAVLAPGYLAACVAALEADPGLSAVPGAGLAAELEAVGVKRDRAMLVARCAVETLTALLDLWSIETSGRDDRVIDEAKALIVAYLAPYFDKGSRRGVPARKRR